MRSKKSITTEKQQWAGHSGLGMDRTTAPRKQPSTVHTGFYTHEVVGKAFSCPEFQPTPVPALPYLMSCLLVALTLWPLGQQRQQDMGGFRERHILYVRPTVSEPE